MKNIELSVVSSEALNQHVQKVMLKPSIPLEFKAGQYMALAVGSDNCRYYSIASPEMETELIELHIESNNTSKSGLDQLLESKQVRLVKLGGEAVLRKDSYAPVLLVAGGVGFSYVRSILLSSLAISPNRDVHVYWVAREEKQLYALDELNDLAKRYQNLKLTTVVKTEKSPRGIDLLFEEIKHEYKTLAHSEVYISGRFDTSHILRERLTKELDALPQNIFSDAFS
ncbi:hypothetical protein ACE34P_002344 [Vibrio fluvialis]|nr:hypothetical protein [Vibrio fluvialis]MBY7958838.1 hypothetical protein [Vibrio fluvialis]